MCVLQFLIFTKFFLCLFSAMNVPCTLGWENMNIALTMYASYFVLFANFFHRSYMKAKLA